MSPSSRRFILDLLIFALIVLGGCIGFMVIEGWTAFDALYMTITTLSTVGFMEVHPLSTYRQDLYHDYDSIRSRVYPLFPGQPDPDDSGRND